MKNGSSYNSNISGGNDTGDLRELSGEPAVPLGGPFFGAAGLHAGPAGCDALGAAPDAPASDAVPGERSARF